MLYQCCRVIGSPGLTIRMKTWTSLSLYSAFTVTMTTQLGWVASGKCIHFCMSVSLSLYVCFNVMVTSFSSRLKACVLWIYWVLLVLWIILDTPIQWRGLRLVPSSCRKATPSWPYMVLVSVCFEESLSESFWGQCKCELLFQYKLFVCVCL